MPVSCKTAAIVLLAGLVLGVLLVKRPEMFWTVRKPAAFFAEPAAPAKRTVSSWLKIRELRILGVDGSAEMVAAAHARGVEAVHADLNEYVPPEPVAATTIFRAIYYARDRRALLERIGGYTSKKLVFDLNPRQYRLAAVQADLRAAGFDRLEVRPFFVPQTRALPAPALAALRALERVGPPARLVLRARFTLICAASRSGGS